MSDVYGAPPPEISGELPAAPPAPAAAAKSPDIAKIDRNMARLVQQNAPDADIQTYLQSEGVTPDQMLAVKQGMIGRGMSAVAGATQAVAGYVSEAYHGKVDPKFADVPAWTGEGISDLSVRSAANRAKLVTYDDAAYGDIVKKVLGPRLVGAEKDMHGQEVITYRDDAGQERKAYVNKPGLDWQDVDRTVASTAPFLLGGGLAASAFKGLPLLGRIALQAPVAAGVSIGADVTAKTMGSEQGVDLPRAGFAASGAVVGEVLSPVIAAAWRRLVSVPRMLDETGALSAAGKMEAARIGLSAEQIASMEGKPAAAFAGAAAYARDPKEVAAQFRTGEFDIPTTKGQRTKDTQLLQMEVEMRRGLWGDQAKQIMRDFDEGQTKAIGEAVTTRIGGEIAPEAAGREKITIGRGIQQGIQTAKAYMDEAENQLWGAAGPMFPREEGFDLLAKRVATSLQDSNIWPKPNLGAYPSSNEMLQFLEDYSKGKVIEQVIPLVGAGRSSIFLDDARRYLLNLYRGAEPKSADAMAAKAIYNGFNGWIDDLADNALLVGQPDTAAALKTARAFTKDMKSLLAPTDTTGKLTPAGRRLDTVFNKADSPESVVDALIPQPATKLRPGDVESLKLMKDLLAKNGAPEAWNDVRLAYWVKISQNDKGQILSPQLLKNRIDAAFTNQRSALNVLYDDTEQNLMKRFADALKDATWVDPNPSGTSYALQSMKDRFQGGSTLQTLLQTQSQREMFSKHNVLASRIYKILARKVPVSFFGSKEGAGAAVAERMTGQALTPRAPPSFAGPGAAVGAELSE
ncbi:MAG: hypothetical protein Q7S17_10080 [Xanthobacteraceae bacterium]|nr:hypothetical protein [Xanthobacteraceae bacterium]